MAPSSADFDSTQGGDAVMRRQKRGPSFKFLVPLIYAPILPLIRIGFRHNPVLRERLFFGVLAGAFAHGTYLVFHDGIICVVVDTWEDNISVFLRTDIYDIESK